MSLRSDGSSVATSVDYPSLAHSPTHPTQSNYNDSKKQKVLLKAIIGNQYSPNFNVGLNEELIALVLVVLLLLVGTIFLERSFPLARDGGSPRFDPFSELSQTRLGTVRERVAWNYERSQ